MRLQWHHVVITLAGSELRGGHLSCSETGRAAAVPATVEAFGASVTIDRLGCISAARRRRGSCVYAAHDKKVVANDAIWSEQCGGGDRSSTGEYEQ
jgi:hypothetical protein